MINVIKHPRAIPFNNGEGMNVFFCIGHRGVSKMTFFVQGGLENVFFLYRAVAKMRFPLYRGLENAIFRFCCRGGLENANFCIGVSKVPFCCIRGLENWQHFFPSPLSNGIALRECSPINRGGVLNLRRGCEPVLSM